MRPCLSQFMPIRMAGTVSTFNISWNSANKLFFSSDTCPMCNRRNPAPHRIFIDLRVDQNNSNEKPAKLVIKGIPPRLLEAPFFKPVLELMSVMQVHISESDIKTVTRIANTLHVTFRQVEHMEAVLKNKHKLKKNPTTSAIVIHEVVDPEVKALFQYSHKLKRIGYKIFFIRDNKVFVKKEQTDSEIEISSKETVNRIYDGNRWNTPSAPSLYAISSSTSNQIPVEYNNEVHRYINESTLGLLRNSQSSQPSNSNVDSDDDISCCCCS